MDDFYEPLPNRIAPASLSGLILNAWSYILAEPLKSAVFCIVAPLSILIATRLLSGHPESFNGNGKTVWMLPYWVPILGHAFSFLYDPINLMSKGRDQSPHGIFALKLGSTTHNIISDPSLVKGVLQQKESVVKSQPIAWNFMEKFFGIPRRSKTKYFSIWEDLTSSFDHLMKEPQLGNMLQRIVSGLEENIPRMISFMESPIDQEPWERSAKGSFVSSFETDIDLMALLRDMLGCVSVPAIFGRAYMENYPDILHDVYEMDKGMMWLLMGLPLWTPIPSVARAHIARFRIKQSMNAFHRALDAVAHEKVVDPAWCDLEDVSPLILERHTMFKEYGFKVEERGDISVLWTMAVNANLLVYWHLLYILSTPGLATRIRTEVAPYATVSKPVAIGVISEAPKLKLSHESLSKNCPLFRSTYLETLRLSTQPWSVRQNAIDLVITGDKSPESSPGYALMAGEYLLMPHSLHMKDPRYFKDPDRFDPERFIVKKGDGTLSTDMGTIRPYGGGFSMCKGRIFAERECLSLVAGVLVFWEIEPVDKKVGWKIPTQKKKSGVSLPDHDTRVTIRRRNFQWEG